MPPPPGGYQATHDEHGAAICRALAYLLLRAEGHATYDQLEGTVHGIPAGRVRFVFEVDAPAMWSTATRLRMRYGLPRAGR